MKKLAFALLLVLALILSGCQTTQAPLELSYYEEKLSVNPDYNTDLFYLNSLDFQVADPSVIYIEEGEQAGYFYAYGTSDDIRVYGFQSWRSPDMTHWESMGVALKPDFNDTWAVTNYWAPEVLYDEGDGLYYMFYSAQNRETGAFEMSVAYSPDPQGPFLVPDNVRNADGKMLSADEPVFDVTAGNTRIASDLARASAIDISPFLDPLTGEKYIYFSYFDPSTKSEIFGMKMKDWFTPDYSTLTRLTATGYLTVAAEEAHDLSQTVPESGVNEGPFMMVHEGTYYLTFSVYGYTDEKYQVRQALSDSPLGTFTKIAPEAGGTVIATDPNWSHITSAGHHSFVYVGDQIFIAYHTFLNRSDISDGRALAVEEIRFVDHDGIDLIHANGPTDSLQPLPEAVSGYGNVALSAEIEASNTASGSSAEYLNDGLLPYLSYDTVPQYVANEGVSTIVLSWEDFVDVRAILIYNSVDYDTSFADIASIRMTYLADGEGNTATVEMKSLSFDWDWNFDANFGQMKPGGAVIAEFADLPLNRIEITFSSVAGSSAAIPEIVVLGKESAGIPATSSSAYGYENPDFGSPELVTEGTTLGSVDGMNTNFGYDLSGDDGTENAVVLQNWPYDQYAYFNGLFSTSFYVEAEFTVTNAKSYASDPYPKFGLTVTTHENTIFFFVDANPTYTQDSVGVAQRTFDNSNWDWNATEQNVSGTGITYQDGRYVKLAILRDGDAFYMLADGKLVIYYDHFNLFTENYPAGVGFLSFNTELSIKNYSATADPETLAEKLALYQSQVEGDTFGIAGDHRTTSGWDLSTDTGEEAYLDNSSKGDQYAYFKDYEGTAFYAETQLTVLRSLGDPYPKFGIVLCGPESEFFFYIESNTSFNSQKVGYVRKVGGNWDWAHAVSLTVSGMAYSNGQYATLGILRDGSAIALYVNGMRVASLTEVPGLTDSACVVGILSFTTSIRITQYRLLTDRTTLDGLNQ